MSVTFKGISTLRNAREITRNNRPLHRYDLVIDSCDQMEDAGTALVEVDGRLGPLIRNGRKAIVQGIVKRSEWSRR